MMVMMILKWNEEKGWVEINGQRASVADDYFSPNNNVNAVGDISSLLSSFHLQQGHIIAAGYRTDLDDPIQLLLDTEGK